MGLGDLVQKAVYLGIGAASYAGEKAGSKLGELGEQLQKLADDMVERGELTTEEARRFVDEKMKTVQQEIDRQASPTSEGKPKAPRQIEILDEDDRTPEPSHQTSPEESRSTPPPQEVNASPENDPVGDMRRQVAKLQDELRRLKRS